MLTRFRSLAAVFAFVALFSINFAHAQTSAPAPWFLAAHPSRPLCTPLRATRRSSTTPLSAALPAFLSALK